jgi:hypothetical protein
VSHLERGQVDGLTVATLVRIFAALDADLVLAVRWRGGGLDRLFDAGHAAIVGAVAGHVTSFGWDLRIEVSFARYAERGSVDLLAWHAPSGTLLAVEVKTEITSVEETLRRHDTKTRLAVGLAAERCGWRADRVARLLVLPDTMTARRRVARHEPIFSRAYPLRGRRLRTWLRRPDPMAGGLIFLSGTHGVRGIQRPPARKRIRRSPLSSSRRRRDRPGPSGVG